ncbi:hypothetical protein [Chryseobacterium oryzae]|uniref:Cytochrome C551 n=1 Tax=Chryseobacterium oryzae TaxID=2929799 RepID=A0ABY4BJI0_9FLAO|nr:hypothetical protein [Chryseobacterium oryzae]UOE39353.1 hypothetical protein MTP08_06155 [Chryseobacterium oryzae]
MKQLILTIGMSSFFLSCKSTDNGRTIKSDSITTEDTLPFNNSVDQSDTLTTIKSDSSTVKPETDSAKR